MEYNDGDGGGNAVRGGDNAGICGKWCGDTVDIIDPGVECALATPPPPPKEADNDAEAADKEDVDPWKLPLRICPDDLAVAIVDDAVACVVALFAVVTMDANDAGIDADVDSGCTRPREVLRAEE